ncbi:MAG: trigger factor family protein, partial [Bacteroidales bacterium]|nr:trigger factor family protein [Bacteroidales bacterium]
MNITKEETGDLTATIKIEVQEDDYKDSVKTVLKDYQKKANMPGFRPGKVPYGIINKMYGKPVIADEVNKLISDSLNNYLQENKIEILGHPIANSEKTKPIDFEHDKSFSFYFDIGMAPEVGLELSDKIKIDYHDIKVDQKTLDKFLDDIRKRNGTHVHPDISKEGDIVRGQMTELDENGNTKENGIDVETSLLTDFIKLKSVKKEMI